MPITRWTSYPRDRRLRVNDVQAITAKLVVTPPRADPMWSNEARVLLDGLVLFLLDVNRRASLGAIYRMVLSVPNFADYIEWAMKEYDGRLDPAAVMQFNGFLGQKRTRNSPACCPPSRDRCRCSRMLWWIVPRPPLVRPARAAAPC